MSNANVQSRLAAKTPEALFLHVLHKEFNFSQRVSRKVLSVAQEMLVGGVPAGADQVSGGESKGPVWPTTGGDGQIRQAQDMPTHSRQSLGTIRNDIFRFIFSTLQRTKMAPSSSPRTRGERRASLRAATRQGGIEGGQVIFGAAYS